MPIEDSHTDDAPHQAQQVMGIVDSEGKTSTFSEDVLKLELSGPGHEHLSVVDVPGIFKRTTDGKSVVSQQNSSR